MKRNLTHSNILWLCVCSIFFGSIASGRTVRVSLGTLAPKNSSYHRLLVAMGQEWRKAPDGGVRLKVYPSGVIGTESDMVREMRVGGIHAALLSSVGLYDIDEAVGNYQTLPMMFRSLNEFDFVYKKIQPQLEKRLEAKGFIVLSWVDAGWVHFFTKDPLKTPDDLKRMKVFSSSNVPAVLDVWRTAGMQAVPLDASDIAMGLQTGMISAVSVPPVYAMAGRMDNIAKYMSDLKWAPLIAATVMHKDTWSKLSPTAQTFVLDSARKTGQEIVVKGRQEAQESIDAMKKRGLTVYNVTPSVEQRWIEMAEPLYPTLRGKLVTEDLFDETLRLLKEYRSQEQ